LRFPAELPYPERMRFSRGRESAMPKRVAVLTVALCLVLAGCGFYRWEKPGAGDNDFKADSASCQSAGGTSSQAYTDCMRSRGWSLTQ
jgi:hypothetical protein